MALDLSKIQEGDIGFTSTNRIIGMIIKACTKSKVEHVFQFIKPFHGSRLLYRCEMVQDVTTKQDIKITNPLKEREIVSVKRPLYAYRSDNDRLTFKQRMINWHETATISYDTAELFSHLPWLGDKKDHNKRNMICSRLVYKNLCLDSGNKLKSHTFDETVTPSDLYSWDGLYEVPGAVV